MRYNNLSDFAVKYFMKVSFPPGLEGFCSSAFSFHYSLMVESLRLEKTSEAIESNTFRVCASTAARGWAREK